VAHGEFRHFANVFEDQADAFARLDGEGLDVVFHLVVAGDEDFAGRFVRRGGGAVAAAPGLRFGALPATGQGGQGERDEGAEQDVSDCRGTTLQPKAPR
jgi:hypothetical protein